ncbi:MAG TPA: hypothetical protein DCL86_10815 [Bacteroidales bacterium]|nr:hypothetical protein [Lentimicrobium sp.]HAH58628.1 hypothetical protein [Bacteroidales bacterium]
MEADNGNDILINGEFTPQQIDQINSGKVKTIEDLTQISDEMLRRISEGYQPKVLFIAEMI